MHEMYLSCYNSFQRLLEIGANVNHADVHNTTPLMDLILVADEDRIIKVK